MPRLSIVIPCAQEASQFEATLASVLQNRPDDCEVMVVQPRPYRDPYGLKDEVRFVEAGADFGVVDLVNEGIRQARAELVNIVSCELEVTEGWLRSVPRHFDDPTVAAVAPLVVTKSGPSRVISRGVHYRRGGVRQVIRVSPRRSAWRAVQSPTFQAGIYRRQAVLEAGGFAPDLGPIFADIDLGLTLEAAHLRCVHDEASLFTSEQAAESTVLSVSNGRAAEQLFWRHAAGTSWADRVLLHPCVCLSECVSNVHRPSQLLQSWGRFTGWLKRKNAASVYADAQRDEAPRVVPLSLPAVGRDERPRNRAA